MMKRCVGIVISVIFGVIICGCGISAGAEPVASGSCGDNATWSYDDSTATLTISGTGDMLDFCFADTEYAERVTAIVVEEGITAICENAFLECYNITDVCLPDTLVTIGACAFYDCQSLTEVSIPNGVCSIIEGAFRNCIALEKINIPDSVTKISPSTFYNCTGLKHIDIPDSVTAIEDYAFQSSGLVELTVPENVESIGQYAFYDTEIEDLNIFAKSLNVKAYAFGNTNLIVVNTNSIKNWCGYVFYNSSSNPIYVSHNLYLNGQLITDLVVPEGVTQIKASNFYSCQNIETILFPTTLETIASNAFRRCSGLKTVTFRAEASNISSGSFKGCFALKDVYYNGTEESYNAAIFTNPFEDDTVIHFAKQHEHQYVCTVVAPTCKDVGYTIYRCESCGDSYITDYTDKLSHDYLVTTGVPTCTTEGYTRYSCGNCDTVIDEYYEMLPHFYKFVGCSDEFFAISAPIAEKPMPAIGTICRILMIISVLMWCEERIVCTWT
ncbi:MAG: leucine-rich repeat domain-containing protein [Eubacterium sp.]